MGKSRRVLSPDGLWKIVHNFFSKNSSKIDAKRKSTAFDIIDCLMSCCAVFSLKFPSLLQYNDNRFNSSLLVNLKNLFHIKNPPSDTSMRERLDVIDPNDVRGVFKSIFSAAQQGKGLEQYKYLDNYYLVSIDGTSHFSSHQVFCENCCDKNHQSGEVTYYHQMLSAVLVHPDIKRVIPFAPEPITRQDGATKNDCEQNAAKRLLQDLRREHPHLKIVVVEDSLYSTGPHINLLKELKLRFIINAKPGNLSVLFNYVEDLDDDDLKKYSYRDVNGKYHEFKFVNNVPLNDSNYDTKVNFLDYWETDNKGKKQHFSWITDIELTENNVEKIMRSGRARWRIENATFNTLKNQGYNFEHNFGHGNKNLCTIMAMMMMLSFTVDQVSELVNELFQKAKAKAGPYYALWERTIALFNLVVFTCWDDLYAVIAGEKCLPLTG